MASSASSPKAGNSSASSKLRLTTRSMVAIGCACGGLYLALRNNNANSATTDSNKASGKNSNSNSRNNNSSNKRGGSTQSAASYAITDSSAAGSGRRRSARKMLPDNWESGTCEAPQASVDDDSSPRSVDGPNAIDVLFQDYKVGIVHSSSTSSSTATAATASAAGSAPGRGRRRKRSSASSASTAYSARVVVEVGGRRLIIDPARSAKSSARSSRRSSGVAIAGRRKGRRRSSLFADMASIAGGYGPVSSGSSSCSSGSSSDSDGEETSTNCMELALHDVVRGLLALPPAHEPVLSTRSGKQVRKEQAFLCTHTHTRLTTVVSSLPPPLPLLSSAETR